MAYGNAARRALDWRCHFAIVVRVFGMRKIIFKPASFIPLGKKRSRQFREGRKPRASRKSWRTTRSAAIWFALFCAYGAATAAMQYRWDAGLGILKSVLVQGVGAGFMAATVAAFVCMAHNRKSAPKNVRQSATACGARPRRLRLYFMPPGDLKPSQTASTGGRWRDPAPV